MSEKIPYLRVGTSYFKIIEKPLISGDKISILVRWNRETIISDCGKTFVSTIPKYDGFCCIPTILNYEKLLKDFIISTMKSLSTYRRKIQEALKENIPFSLKFMEHIFGEQLELGLDY
jgi:hypothetical protein